MMGFMARWRLSRAARRYALNLPAELAQNYGASALYTRRQIAAAAGRRRLPSEFLWLGYALFLSEPEFVVATRDSAPPLTYEQARTLVERFRPPRQPHSRWENSDNSPDWTDPGAHS